MRKIIISTILLSLLVLAISPCFVNDANPGTSVDATPIVAEETVEGIILNGMKGRAGAAVPTANKGIVFEKLYALKLN